MFFNFVFLCSFGCFDRSPEIVTGLFSIVSVSGFKGRCPRWQGWSNIAVNPRFLVGVDTNCFGRNYIIYTLPDETCYRIWIRLYVIVRRCPEHVPVHVIKTVLKCSVWLVRPALYCPEGGCFMFQFLPISRQEQNEKSDPICRKVGGGGTCMRPGRGSNNGRVYDLHSCWWWRVESILELLFWSWLY